MQIVITLGKIALRLILRGIIDIIKAILKLMNKGREMIEYVKDRPGHDLRYAIDFNKIQKELDWEPKIEFKKGLKTTVDWYKNNQKWWKKIKTGKYQDYYKKNVSFK